MVLAYLFCFQKFMLHNNFLFLFMVSGQLITGSWDKTLKCWDPRGASGQERTLVGTYPQPERVYSLSLVGNRLVVATAGRHVNVYDLRNMSQPEQRRESSLKYQTRCVRCYPNGTGICYSIVLECIWWGFPVLVAISEFLKIFTKSRIMRIAITNLPFPFSLNLK